jgi:hypothetical protein
MSPYNCFYHPNLPAVAVCSRCGRGTCASCSKPYGALTLCPNCFHTIPPPQMAPGMAPSVTPGMAPGMVAAYPVRAQPGYGPFFPFRFFRSQWMAIILVGIAAALIIINGVALLSSTFFTIWSMYIPWVVFLGALGVITGVMLGLVLFGALILILLRFRVMAAFMIFPTAIVSLLIGGGFIIGAVLAVLAAILLLL